jgi:hypothetical protein
MVFIPGDSFVPRYPYLLSTTIRENEENAKSARNAAKYGEEKSGRFGMANGERWMPGNENDGNAPAAGAFAPAAGAVVPLPYLPDLADKKLFVRSPRLVEPVLEEEGFELEPGAVEPADFDFAAADFPEDDLDVTDFGGAV